MAHFKFIEGIDIYFVTFTVIKWLPLFQHPEAIQIIMDSLLFCISEKYLQIYAYVIMPDHIHLVVFDKECDNQRLRKTLVDFRKFTGRMLADYIDLNFAGQLSSVTWSSFLKDRQRQIWQPGWHAEGIASEYFLQQKIDYIHENPVRKRFVCYPERWEHSSAGFWYCGKDGPLPIGMLDAKVGDEKAD